MHFSTLALAAVLAASVHGACTPKVKSKGPDKLHSYPAAPMPETLNTFGSFGSLSSLIPSFLTPPAVMPASAPAPAPAAPNLFAAAPETPPAAPNLFSAGPEAPPAPAYHAAVPPPATYDAAPPAAPVTLPPAAPAAPAGEEEHAGGLSADQRRALAAHNAARAAAGARPLAWDGELARAAQEWGDHLAGSGAPPGTLKHSSGTGQGENLYWSGTPTGQFEAASLDWAAEKSAYHGEPIVGGGSGFMAYGHYTQIVWKTTTKVGMAIANDGHGGVYVVARYFPPGNMIGQTPMNAT